MANPFEIIDAQFKIIERLLSDIMEHLKGETVIKPKDVGGVEIAIQETGLSIHSIYRLASQRKIPHSKKGGRLYFSRMALQKWIQGGNRQVH